MRNYNTLIDRYPGADGMKTGFICASGFNLVASATRNGRRLIAVVLGAYSGAVRAQKAAQLLERGFNSGGAVLADALARHRRRAGADRRRAAQPARRNVRRASRKPPSEDNRRGTRKTPASGRQRWRRRRPAGLHAVRASKPANRQVRARRRRSRPRRRSWCSPGPADQVRDAVAADRAAEARASRRQKKSRRQAEPKVPREAGTAARTPRRSRWRKSRPSLQTEAEPSRPKPKVSLGRAMSDAGRSATRRRQPPGRPSR